jgi:predicted DCC family thiol-disulfide oxidoreductase YuxK
MPHPILLYDGVCGLCNRFVQFILRRDRNAIFRFASLQSDFASGILARHSVNPSDLDTVYVVVNPDSQGLNQESKELLLCRSDAALFVLKQLRRPWRSVAFLLQLLPKFLRDSTYNAIARRRYRIFGRYDACPTPSTQDRNRFVDL